MIKRKSKKSLAAFLAVTTMLVMTQYAFTASADNNIPFIWGSTSNNINTSGTINLETQNPTNAETDLTVSGGNAVTIVGNGGTYYNLKIVISGGAHVTLDNVNINNDGSGNILDTTAPAVEAGDGNTGNTLYIEGSNALTGGFNCAGVEVDSPNALIIDKAPGETDTSCSLIATGAEYNGAGIGGKEDSSAGSVTIRGGSITAQANSSNHGAGIGGGGGSSGGTGHAGGGGGTILISGGIVQAFGYYGGAGIGGGQGGDGEPAGGGGAGGSVTITGGTVSVTGAIGPGNGSPNGNNGANHFDGGSVSASGGINPQPTASGGTTLYEIPVTTQFASAAVHYTVANGHSIQTSTDASGNFTLWLPDNTADILSVTTDNNPSVVSHFLVRVNFPYDSTAIALSTACSLISYPSGCTLNGMILSVPAGTTASDLLSGVTVSTDASKQILSSGNPVTGTTPLASGMVLRVTAQDTTVYQNYTISTPSIQPTQAPTASPAGGSVASGTAVTLRCTTGAVIHYTTDGTSPTTSSSLYSGPITVSSAMTIKAIAVLNGITSSVMTVTYTITQTPTPTPSPSPVPVYINQTGFSFTGSTITKNYGDAPFNVTTTGGQSTGAVTFQSSSDVVSVDNTGKVTINKSGTATITATKAGDGCYYPATATVTITVSPANQTGFAFSEASVDKDYGDAPFNVTATGGQSTGAVTYQSSSDAVSVDNTGKITVNNVGTATITATKAGDGNYNAATATMTVNVAKADPSIMTKPKATPITVVGKLSSSKLTGGSGSVPGSFLWDNSDTVVSKSDSYDVIFTPDDTDHYNPVTLQVNVTVNPVLKSKYGIKLDFSHAALQQNVTSVLLANSVVNRRSAVYAKLMKLQKGKYKNMLIYALKLLNQSKKAISGYKSYVTVKIPISAKAKSSKVFFFDIKAGKRTDMHARYGSGFLTFKTTKLGFFAVVK